VYWRETRKYSKEDQEPINSIERDEWQSVADLDSIKAELEKAAETTAIKDYRINIRISKRDVEALKTKDMEEGIPYMNILELIDRSKKRYNKNKSLIRTSKFIYQSIS
jgi:predicted DNA binding CopG/RHH family protein